MFFIVFSIFVYYRSFSYLTKYESIKNKYIYINRISRINRINRINKIIEEEQLYKQMKGLLFNLERV